MSRILIVEDEPALAELVAINLRHAGHQITVAANAEQAHAAMQGPLPDLVLLDWMLPQTSGWHLARMWRQSEKTKSVPIIMLTARAEESDKLAGFEVGVDDYITKPFSVHEMVARVRALLRRAPSQPPDTVVGLGGLTLDPATHRVTCEGQPLRLGPTEFRLLHFLLTHPERVHNRSQLLDAVWGDQTFVEERTVDVHIKRLREALVRVQRDRMIETVRGTGYRLARNPEHPAA
jgi:two-component system, OmpR family, phosphate regulon response regulator PhoB